MTTPAARTLPVDATPTRTSLGWSVRLPVRSEEVTLSKQTVVYERVLVGRRGIQEVAHVEAELRREELRATASGDAKIATRDSRANKHVGTGGS